MRGLQVCVASGNDLVEPRSRCGHQAATMYRSVPSPASCPACSSSSSAAWQRDGDIMRMVAIMLSNLGLSLFFVPTMTQICRYL